MQFFVQDMREWGNKKILQSFVKSETGKNALFERLRLQNMLLSDLSCKSYSLPKNYKRLYEKIKDRYFGIEFFMNNCEPLILSMDTPAKSIQRRFRNQWEGCWACLGKSLNLLPETTTMVQELGIRLCYVEDLESIPDEVFDFYNTILKWYVYTSTDGALEESGMTGVGMIEHMILQKPSMFVHDIQVGFWI